MIDLNKPNCEKFRLLDLFCCGGSGGYGYEKAGFEVVGVDILTQPKHKGNFVQSDAFEYLKEYGHLFDAIHASPPCQEYSPSTKQFRMAGKEYPDLIAQTREALIKSGKPYVIENVPNSPLVNPVVLCGTMFGMRTYRHRLFESNIHIDQPEHPEHTAKNAKMGRPIKDDEFIQYVGHFPGVKMVQEMCGTPWLGQKELAQSIPPQYTKYIGLVLIEYLKKNL
jgi:DNA (cytosine-5)-methyltransferase 1